MITTLGKTHIKRYLAGQVPDIGQALAIGIGSDAATLGDRKMALETARIPINLTAYDPVLDRLIFKAEIPDGYTGKITEVGLFSLVTDPTNDAPAITISEFTQGIEQWSDGTWSTANTRLGADSLRLSPSSGQTLTATKSMVVDYSRFSPSDAINLAVNNLNTNASNIRVRFLQDAGNHFTRTFAGTPAGYSVLSGAKSSFTVTGNPSWAGITAVQVEVTGGAGAAQVDFDALTFVDMDFVNTNMVLVAREVLSTPYVKVSSTVNEIEFSMAVNF